MKIQVVRKGNLFINKDFSEFLDALDLACFDDFMQLEGMVVKSAVRENFEKFTSFTIPHGRIKRVAGTVGFSRS
jgi:hypothetical protein